MGDLIISIDLTDSESEDHQGPSTSSASNKIGNTSKNINGPSTSSASNKIGNTFKNGPSTSTENNKIGNTSKNINGPSTSSASNKIGNTSKNINGPSTSTSNTNGNTSSTNSNDNVSTQVIKITRELQKLSSEVLDSFLYTVEQNEPDYDWKKTKIKIWKYFDNLDEKYKHSEQFINLIKSQLEMVNNNPKQTLQTVINLKDDLRSNQKINLNINDDESRHKLQKINRLEKVLWKLERHIKKYETAEIDFSKDEDCDENSYYIKLERFKERFVQVHKKLCSLKKEQPVRGISLYHVEVDHTPFRDLNEEIEQNILKIKKFPDFKDIHNIIENYNKNNNSKLDSMEVIVYAKKIFESVGLQIKRRRCFDFYQNMGSLLRDQVETDPADVDKELAEKLKENAKIFKKKLSSVIEKYCIAERTKQIVAEEIPDNIASSEGEEGESDKEDKPQDDEDNIETEDEKDYRDEISDNEKENRDIIEIVSESEKENEEEKLKEEEEDNDILEIEEIHLKSSPTEKGKIDQRNSNKSININRLNENNTNPIEKSNKDNKEYSTSSLIQRAFVDSDTLEIPMGEKNTKIEEINLDASKMKLNYINSTNPKIEEIVIDSDTEAPPTPFKQISIATKKITQFFTRVNKSGLQSNPTVSMKNNNVKEQSTTFEEISTEKDTSTVAGSSNLQRRKKKPPEYRLVDPISFETKQPTASMENNNFKEDPISSVPSSPTVSKNNDNFKIEPIIFQPVNAETIDNNNYKNDPPPLIYTGPSKDLSTDSNFKIVQIAIPISSFERMQNNILKLEPVAIPISPIKKPMETKINRNFKRKPFVTSTPIPAKRAKKIEEDDDIILLD